MATGLSDRLDGVISHDKVTRFLHQNTFGSKELWQYVKPTVQEYEAEIGGALLIDDSIIVYCDAKTKSEHQKSEVIKSKLLLQLIDLSIKNKVFKNENGSTGALILPLMI